MKDYGYDNISVGKQMLNGVFTSIWLLSLPFVGLYKLLRWFVTEVTKEVGTRLVKYTAGIVVTLIIALIYSLIN